MKLKEALLEEGIKATLTAQAVGTYHISCPKEFCIENRSSDENQCLTLEVISKSHAKWKCNHCLWSDKVGEPEDNKKSKVESIDDWTKLISSYQITDKVLKANSVLWHHDMQLIGIPYHYDHTSYYTYNGIVVDKVKTKPLDEFYRIDSVDDKNTLYIVQNEFWCLSLLSMGFTNVISVPHGSTNGASKFDFIFSAADVLQACPKVILVFDTTQFGESLRHELIRRIGPAKCWSVKFSHISFLETILELGVDTLCEDIKDATPCPITGLYELTDFERSLVNYFDGGMASGVSTGWENIDFYYTIVPAQLTLVTGIPNMGKSELIDAMTLNIAESEGWKFALFSPENGKEAHATKLIEKKVMMPSDPNSSKRMSRETFLSGAGWVHAHYYFISSDSRKEPTTIEWVLERAKDAVLRYGIQGLVIDPFNRLRKSKDAPDNVDQYVAYVLDLILSFAEMHRVHVWLVAHPKTLEPDRKTRKYPVPGGYDISGGANFVNMADNIIVVHRSEDIADATEIHVKKIRFKHVGKRTKVAPILEYNIDTGRYKMPDDGGAYYSMFEKEIESIEPK